MRSISQFRSLCGPARLGWRNLDRERIVRLGQSCFVLGICPLRILRSCPELLSTRGKARSCHSATAPWVHRCFGFYTLFHLGQVSGLLGRRSNLQLG